MGPLAILALLAVGGLYLLDKNQSSSTGTPTGAGPSGQTININTGDDQARKGQVGGMGGGSGGGVGSGGSSAGKAAGNGTQLQNQEDTDHPAAAYSNTTLDGEAGYELTKGGEQLQQPQLGDSLPGSAGSSDNVVNQAEKGIDPGQLTLSGANDYAADQSAEGNNFQLTEPQFGIPTGFGSPGSGDSENYDSDQSTDGDY